MVRIAGRPRRPGRRHDSQYHMCRRALIAFFSQELARHVSLERKLGQDGEERGKPTSLAGERVGFQAGDGYLQGAHRPLQARRDTRTLRSTRDEWMKLVASDLRCDFYFHLASDKGSALARCRSLANAGYHTWRTHAQARPVGIIFSPSDRWQPRHLADLLMLRQMLNTGGGKVTMHSEIL